MSSTGNHLQYLAEHLILLVKFPAQLLQKIFGLLVVGRRDIVLGGLLAVFHQVLIAQKERRDGQDIKALEISVRQSLNAVTPTLFTVTVVGRVAVVDRATVRVEEESQHWSRTIAGILAALPQPVPQLHHTQVWIAAAHVPNQLHLRLCVLIGMAMGPPGQARQ